MSRVWAVARQTFSQCLRMKVAAVFILLLTLILACMPLLTKGDGTLAGRCRTLLAYTMAATSALLSIVTIFLAAGIVAGDIRQKQIFTLASKPLGRWQYIVGRWLGVVLLNVMLLVPASATIYFLALNYRDQPALNSEDRRAVETEVFASRDRISPEPLNVEEEVAQRIQALKNEGAIADAIETYKIQTGGDEQQARQALVGEISKQVLEARQSAAPGRGIHWKFSGIKAGAWQTTAPGAVTGRDDENRLLRISTAPALAGSLVYMGPVRIGDTDARVVDLAEDVFVAEFAPEDFARPQIAGLLEGKQVQLSSESTIQIRYQAAPAGQTPLDTLQSLWIVENPSDRMVYNESRNDSVSFPSTLTVPSRLVDAEGKLLVGYLNRSPVSVIIPQSDIAVLYRVGGFGGNFLRGVLLIVLQIMFLAAIGVCAAAFLSFPVACLVSFGILPFGLAREFLVSSVQAPADGRDELLLVLGRGVVNIMNVFLPDMGRTSPVDALVDGMNISWAFVGETALLTLILRTAIVLLLACIIFQKRELARVQV